MNHPQRPDDLKPDDFLSVVSHELRTPLSSAKEAIALLREGFLGPLTPEQSKVLDLASNNLGRMRTLINDLLDLSRIKARKFPMRRGSADLKALGFILGPILVAVALTFFRVYRERYVTER